MLIMDTITILIVEDEADILNLLKYNFQSEGYEALTAKDGEQALEIVERQKPDVLLLDIMLPGMDGIEVCKTLKAKSETRDIPVVMLTAKGEEEDRISGFELGIDDYVVKPFSPRELILRVGAVLRRSKNPPKHDDVWEHGGLRVDFGEFRVMVDDQEADLTATEFNLLAALIKANGRVLSREHLLDKVWGYEFMGYARTVDTHMHRLRQKIGPYADWIHTVRGIGYRLKAS